MISLHATVSNAAYKTKRFDALLKLEEGSHPTLVPYNDGNRASAWYEIRYRSNAALSVKRIKREVRCAASAAAYWSPWSTWATMNSTAPMISSSERSARSPFFGMTPVLPVNPCSA